MDTEVVCERRDGKVWFLWKMLKTADNSSLLRDIIKFHKAIVFIESFHFYLKVKNLLHVFIEYF